MREFREKKCVSTNKIFPISEKINKCGDRKISIGKTEFAEIEYNELKWRFFREVKITEGHYVQDRPNFKKSWFQKGPISCWPDFRKDKFQEGFLQFFSFKKAKFHKGQISGYPNFWKAKF